MKRNKKHLMLLGGILAAAVITLAVLCMRIAPTVNHALHISQLLQPMLEAEDQAMHISAATEVDGRSFALEADIFLTTEDEIRFLTLDQNNSAVYVANNLLILENGKAFRLGETMQQQTLACENLLSQIGTLFDTLTISAEETETETLYSVTVTGEQAKTLLAALSLGDGLPADSIQQLDLCLTEQNGKLEQIRFTGSGQLNGTAVELDVTVSGFRILASEDYPIPDAVKSTVATADPDELFSLTEDLYRLVLALTDLTDMESLDGKLAISVDCSLLQLDTEFRLSDLTSSSAGQFDPEQLQALPEMIALLCMEGNISSTQTGNGYVYTLALEEAAMQQLSQMILPELAQYRMTLTEGAVTVTLADSTVISMAMTISGKIQVLITQLPITLNAAFTFD